jgi:hypothetical protein
MRSRTLASSSASRIVSRPPTSGADSTGAPVSSPAACAGRCTAKVVPLLTWLFISMKPRCWRTIPYTMARPRPVPDPTSFVVKKGSKMLLIVKSSIPVPESVTDIHT